MVFLGPPWAWHCCEDTINNHLWTKHVFLNIQQHRWGELIHFSVVDLKSVCPRRYVWFSVLHFSGIKQQQTSQVFLTHWYNFHIIYHLRSLLHDFSRLFLSLIFSASLWTRLLVVKSSPYKSTAVMIEVWCESVFVEQLYNYIQHLFIKAGLVITSYKYVHVIVCTHKSSQL